MMQGKNLVVRTISLVALLTACGPNGTESGTGVLTPVTTGGSTPVTTGGSTPVTTGGSTPVTTGGSTPVTTGGTTLVTMGGATLVTTGGTTLVTMGGATLVAVGGSMPVTGGVGTAGGSSAMLVGSEKVPESLVSALTAAASLDGNSIGVSYPAPATTVLDYEPTTATGMELIQGSTLALNDNELATLGKNGLVISQRRTFPSFAYGYKSIYFADLPVYVSADSILEAVHRTFDSLLKQTEQLVLIGQLASLLDGMRVQLASVTFDETITRDADVYLTVAASLLKGAQVAPLASSNTADVESLYKLATAASGHQTVQLFGVARDEDFSQFEPRGHYSDSPELGRYFKAMMWLGRVDLRLIETQGDGTQVFHRRQFDAAVALRQLMGPTEYSLWNQIDATIGAFVGEHDSMTPKDVAGLMEALKVTSLSETASLTDQRIVDEITSGGWGQQRIASRIIVKNDATGPTLPLDRSFMVFGQRYTVDSNVFVNVTYDRVADRMMPNPLDAAFAALGNNAALPLVSAEFANQSYVQGLAKSRALVDAHESAYWEGSIYTRWLGALRSLSPKADAIQPSVTKTAAWQTRILSSQLGSWSELRHDTILYAKQSYTAGVSCEFPDAYVDPYPEFYAQLGGLADAVGGVVQNLPSTANTLKSTAQTWVSNFKAVADNLQKMAEDQVTGVAHSAELLAFINDAVKWDESSICGGVTRTNLSGWYLKLFLYPDAGVEYAPMVADVHTQPTDEAGNDVGRVLHVGTGAPRLMVVTVDSCQGPRAYAGLAFSYGEKITENWTRLNDTKWSDELAKNPFPDVSWMSNVLAK